MRKSANVLEVIDQNTAKVMLHKHKKCRGCGACNKHLHPGSIVEAANPAHAKQGEMVDVNVHKRFSLIEFSLVYLLPVAAFFGGLFLGSVLFDGKNGAIASMGMAFILLFVAVVINIIFKERYHPNYTVSIMKVTRPAEPRL